MTAPHNHAEGLLAKVETLANEWKRLSGLASPLSFDALEKASPAQRTLWEVADEVLKIVKGSEPI